MKKGQIISLDFMLSMILVVLALGLMMQFIEIKSYDLKEKELYEEVASVGRTAANLLVSNPDIVCELETGSTKSSLNNCIPNNKIISKTELGIPDGFGCKIDGVSSNCNGSPPGSENIYSEKRKVVFGSETVQKSTFDNCVRNGCSDLTEREITIWVWKT